MRVSLLARAGVLLVAAAALLPLGQPARAADEAHTLTVRMDWLPSGYQAPVFLAAVKGWYKDAGLDVSIVAGTGSATTVQLVASGQFDIGHAALSNMAFGRAKGMPVISIAGFFRKGDLALLVPNDLPIKKPADVKGKKLLYTAGSLELPFLDSFLKVAGLTRNEVDLLSVNAAAKQSTYAAGGPDGVFSTATFQGLVIHARPSRYMLFADYGLNIPGFGLLANQTALKNKGPAIRAFASIVAGAWTYTENGHQEEAIQALMKMHENERVDVDLMRAQLTMSPQFLFTKNTEHDPIGVQSAADWATSLALMEKAGVIQPGAKPADYFTNAYLDINEIKKIGAKN